MRSRFDFWVGKIPWRRVRLLTPVFLVFPCGSASKKSAFNEEDLGSIPGLGRSPGEWKGYPLQYSGLENSTDCIVYGVTKSQTGLSDFHFSLHSPFILSRTEYWSGLSFPSPGDLPNPGIKPRSPILQSDSLPADPPGKALVGLKQHKRKVHIPWVFHLPSKNFVETVGMVR